MHCSPGVSHGPVVRALGCAGAAPYRGGQPGGCVVSAALQIQEQVSHMLPATVGCLTVDAA